MGHAGGRRPRLGLVVGLKAEARLFAAASPWPVAIAGGDAKRAADMARALAAGGAEFLVSVGIAGALDPTLRPGDLVIADAIVFPDGQSLATADLFAISGIEAVRGPLAGSDVMVTSVADKAALRRRTGAIAVDMESHGVARAAADLGLPFAAWRAIADPASRAVPPSAIVGMDSDGNTRPLAVARALITRPRDLPGLIALARDADVAMRTLKKLAGLLARP